MKVATQVDAADEVPGDEVAVGHFAHPGHKRRKGADDGHEARQEDGLAAVFFEEGMGAVHVFLLDPFDFAGIGFGTDAVTDPVIGRIPAYGGNGQQDETSPGVECAAGRKCGGGKDERIAGQERGDDEASLHER